MTNRFATKFCLTTLFLFACAAASAVTVETDSNVLTWAGLEPSKEYGYQLTISGSDGFYLSKSFKPGEVVSISVEEFPQEGAFVSEAVPVPAATSAQSKPVADNQRGLGSGLVGTNREVIGFSLLAGELITPVEEFQAKTNIIADDQIVQGGLCVGIDCNINEQFSFRTLILSENNLRLVFEDSSSSASFPGNDWRIDINDTTNGGLNHFSIVDQDANRTPFRIEAGAATNALYIEADSDVGLGTANPVVEFHVVDGDTPTVRLEQDGSSGFDPLVWDMAGNETNFFIRDVTNGSVLPFRIRPGNGNDDAIVILGSGNVGMGNDTPDQELHISEGGSVIIALENTSGGADGTDWVIGNNDDTDRFEISDTTNEDVTDDADGAEFSLDPTGNLTIAGLLVQNSNRHAKQDFTEVDAAEVLAKLRSLPVTQWRFKQSDGQHIGPMAQDFYAAFGLGTKDHKIAMLDVAGVSLLAIQELDRQLKDKNDQVADLQAQVEALQKQAEQLEDYEKRLAMMETLITQLAASKHSDQSELADVKLD